jgi:hypothetical protein
MAEALPISDDHLRVPADHSNIEAIDHLAGVFAITPASIRVAHSEDAGVIDEPVEQRQVRRSEPSNSVHSVDRRDMECCRMRQVAVNFRDLRSRWLVPEKGYSAAQISGGHH